MLITGLVLIALGVIFGLFFPVMFVAAAAGVVLLVLFVVAGARRATDETGASQQGVDTLE
jgi:hypothetical protein